MQYIDVLLNKVTMYRLTLYYLIFLVGVAVVLGFFNLIVYNPLDILIDSFIAVSVCYISNYVLAKIFRAETNVESVFITALILVLIIPVKLPLNLSFLVLASVVAMASKYFLTIDKKHVFNPAAFAVASIALLSPEHSATWWVGIPAMVPFVLFGGLLLVRKIQREKLVFSFLISYLIIVALGSLVHTASLSSIVTTWQLSVINSALFFFMFLMLTEPLTSPTREKLQVYYAYVVAFLYSTPILRLGIVFTPEIALCLGNVFSYVINPNYRFVLPLKWKKQVSSDTFVFVFDKMRDFKFIPGQYMEWTLPHKNSDSRGNRRYFSISTSPTENTLGITVKFYKPSSSYKQQLINMGEGKPIIASQVAGDFILPDDLNKPLVFIAGGVGIAPFRSMVKYVIDKNIKVDIVLLYTNRTKEDILFSDVFGEAARHGVRTVYNLTDLAKVPQDWQGAKGYINEDSVRKLIPDYKNRTYYLSGPQLMVQRFERTLTDTGVTKDRIKTDFFPGYSET